MLSYAPSFLDSGVAMEAMVLVYSLEFVPTLASLISWLRAAPFASFWFFLCGSLLLDRIMPFGGRIYKWLEPPRFGCVFHVVSSPVMDLFFCKGLGFSSNERG